VANCVPGAIVTDELFAYNDAIKSEFCGIRPVQNPHIILKGFEIKPNYNVRVRLNETFRDHMMVVRILDNALDDR
jgi:hypothetical protein